MEKSSYDIETVYFKHIGRQLLRNMFSNAILDIYVKKIFHPEKNYNFKGSFDKDDLYMRILSRVADKKIDYYIKNLEISIDECNYEIVDLKYDYYGKNEIILKTDINYNFV